MARSSSSSVRDFTVAVCYRTIVSCWNGDPLHSDAYTNHVWTFVLQAEVYFGSVTSWFDRSVKDLVLCCIPSISAICVFLFRAETAALTDERIRTMSEVISGIRVIKMYGWEKPFGALVDEVRRCSRVCFSLNFLHNFLWCKFLLCSRAASHFNMPFSQICY